MRGTSVRSFLLATFLACLASACGLVDTDSGGRLAKTSALPQHRLTGVAIQPLDRKQEGAQTHLFHSDTLRGQVVFMVRTLSKIVGDGRPGTGDTAGDTAGDESPGEILNPTVWGESVFSFDRPIQVRGETVAAGTNLLELPDFLDVLYFPMQLSPFALHEAHLRLEHVQVPRGLYHVYLSWRTTDGLTLSDTVEVFIDVP